MKERGKGNEKMASEWYQKGIWYQNGIIMRLGIRMEMYCQNDNRMRPGIRMRCWCYSLGLVDVSVAGRLQHAWLNEEECVLNEEECNNRSRHERPT